MALRTPHDPFGPPSGMPPSSAASEAGLDLDPGPVADLLGDPVQIGPPGYPASANDAVAAAEADLLDLDGDPEPPDLDEDDAWLDPDGRIPDADDADTVSDSRLAWMMALLEHRFALEDAVAAANDDAEDLDLDADEANAA